MKCIKFATSLSLFTAMLLSALTPSADAATCSLTIAGKSTSYSVSGGSAGTIIISWTNTVQLSSKNSSWTQLVSHWNNLTRGLTFSETDPNWTNFSAGQGGSHYFDEPYPLIGSYDCYCIDSGMTSGQGVSTPWSDVTNHVTINITP